MIDPGFYAFRTRQEKLGTSPSRRDGAMLQALSSSGEIFFKDFKAGKRATPVKSEPHSLLVVIQR
jgi:hypothetical protein